MSERLVICGQDGAIGQATVNRPEALNALNAAVIDELEAAIAGLAADKSCRVIVLRGACDRAFVAGADVNEFAGASPSDALAIAERTRRLHLTMASARQPVIGAIDGYCLSGGFELALACDIRIASRKARFGLPEIRLGIIPGGGGTVRLTKIAGTAVGRQLAMTGDMIDAERAFALGLVASVHDHEEFEGAVRDVAGRLASYSPFSLAQLKSALDAAVDGDVKSACEAEMRAFALCFSTADQKEGVSAFLEKRPAVFRGK